MYTSVCVCAFSILAHISVQLCVCARLCRGRLGRGVGEALQWSTEKNHSFIQQLTPSG